MISISDLCSGNKSHTPPMNVFTSSCRPWAFKSMPILFLSALSSSWAGTANWDANGAAAGTGGDGTWQNLVGANWRESALRTWDNSTDSLNVAAFENSGDVTVQGEVKVQSIQFRAISVDYNFSGTGAVIVSPTSSSTRLIQVVAGATGTKKFDTAVQVEGTGFNLATNAQYWLLENNSSSDVVFNKKISVAFTSPASTPAGVKTLLFSAADGSSTILNEQVEFSGSSGTASLALMFGANASGATAKYYVNGDNSAVTGQSNVSKGAVYVGHNNAFGVGGVSFSSASGSNSTMALLTNGAFTVANALKVQPVSGITDPASIHVVVGGATADQSTFSGTFSLATVQNNAAAGAVGVAELTAVAGGRVDFTGQLSGNSGKVIKTGEGIVALSANNTYRAGRSTGGAAVVGTEVRAGTLLLMNTTGSATGGSADTQMPSVEIWENATLGGLGFTTGQVRALGGASVLSAGDMSLAGVSSIGTLNLTGGLNASQGVTIKIDIDAAGVDQINFGSGAVVLGGTVLLDFTSIGSGITPGIGYSLFSGTGSWSGNPLFNFTGIEGFAVDSYSWKAAENSFTITFSTIPEPSAYGFILGAVGLTACLFRRRHTSCSYN